MESPPFHGWDHRTDRAGDGIRAIQHVGGWGQDCMTSDWREVYLQEKRRPGYVIKNGSLPRRDQDSGDKQKAVVLRQPRKKAA